MNRRTVLLSGVALAVGGDALISLRLWSGDSMGGMTGMNMDHSMEMTPAAEPQTSRILVLPEGAPLKPLTKLANTSSKPGVFEARLTAAPATVEFSPGKSTTVLAYNGTAPGPLIEATEGDRVRIEFVNAVPDQPSTIHWHGIAVPPDQDGGPMDPVATGTNRFYEFTLAANAAAPTWYHPHAHGLTDQQVYRGLAGAFIVKPKIDPLPAELGDTVLFISDLRLASDGSLPGNGAADMMNGREGDHLLVNGQKNPVLTVNPGSSQRFRLFNATNARFLRLAFEGHEMTLVGTDGGLLASPVTGFSEMLLAPGERSEIVVHFKAAPGAFRLQALGYERGWMGQGKPDGATKSVLTVNLAGDVKTPIALLAKLRDIADLGAAVANKRVLFSETMSMAGGGMTMGYLIDGRKFDMHRIDQTSKVNDVELWEVINTADMDHPFHMHGTQFQIVERDKDNKKSPAPFLAWKDTANITSGETLRLKVRHQFAGLRMYHCHVLEHESQGMMAVLNVV